MANLKDTADNGTLLALGLVGVVAAVGAFRTRGAPASRGSRTVVGSLAALTQMDRARLPARDFVFPEDRSYPIHDYRHGQLALTYAATPSNRLRRYRVMDAVFRRYPKLRAWWNTTEVGSRDPANPNSWRTTLYQYQALLPKADADERADLAGEIEALQSLVGATPRTTRPRRAA